MSATKQPRVVLTKEPIKAEKVKADQAARAERAVEYMARRAQVRKGSK